MFLWILLFVLVIVISFILALKSMGDYREIPTFSQDQYSLFLINKPENLSDGLLEEWFKKVLKKKLIISLEKLYKGTRQALVVFGPVELLHEYKSLLGLVELEDYSRKFLSVPEDKKDRMGIWEWGVKTKVIKPNAFLKINLADNEQVWWQVVLQPITGILKEGSASYSGLIRLVILAENRTRVEQVLSEIRVEASTLGLAVLPKAFTNEQIVKFYQERSLPSDVYLFDLSLLAKNKKEQTIFRFDPREALNLTRQV